MKKDDEAQEIKNGTESAAEDAAEVRASNLKTRYTPKKKTVPVKKKSNAKKPNVSYSPGSRTPSGSGSSY